MKKWIDTERPETYERFVRDWHDLLEEMREIFRSLGTEKAIRDLTLYILQSFYRRPYRKDEDFFSQFDERRDECRHLLET